MVSGSNPTFDGEILARYHQRSIGSSKSQNRLVGGIRASCTGCVHLAFLALFSVGVNTAFSSLSLDQGLDLVNELVIQRPDRAEEAVREVVRIFIVGKPENYGSIWSDWLAAWMTQRLSGVPRIASAEELSAWADLAPFIADHAHDALELLDGNPPPFGQHFQYPEDLAALRPIISEHVGHLANRMRATGIADSIMAYRAKSTN